MCLKWFGPKVDFRVEAKEPVSSVAVAAGDVSLHRGSIFAGVEIVFRSVCGSSCRLIPVEVDYRRLFKLFVGSTDIIRYLTATLSQFIAICFGLLHCSLLSLQC